MPTLSLPTDYLARLILKVRGLQAQEGEVDVASGSNPADDRMIDAVQDTPGDLTREELREEIAWLNDRQRRSWSHCSGGAAATRIRKTGNRPSNWRASAA